MAAAPPELPPLPESVEVQLRVICREKMQHPADAVARRYLSEVGEPESLRILSIIRNTTAEVRNLSKYIVHLAKNSSLPTSPMPLTNSPQGNASSGLKRKRESYCPGELSTVRRVCIFSSPVKIEEKLDVPKSKRDIVLDAFEKLEFRKAFLILNYIGSAVLEDVVSADQIQSYQRLGMREFENEIWNDFRHIGQGKERVIKMNWETGERYYYHCHVDSKGNYRFKGPILNKAATLLQKVVGDENVLIVKFMEQEIESVGKESLRQSPVFNEVAENGIFVGRKCYRFFGEFFDTSIGNVLLNRTTFRSWWNIYKIEKVLIGS